MNIPLLDKKNVGIFQALRMTSHALREAREMAEKICERYSEKPDCTGVLVELGELRRIAGISGASQ